MLAQTRKEKKQMTRLRLVDSGMQVFAQQGFQNTSVDEVARNISVSHGTVFLHFPKREDLIVAVLDEFGTRLSEAFNQASAQEGNLRDVLKAHLEVLEKYEDFYSRIVREEAYLPSYVQSLFFIIHAAVSQKIFLSAEKEMKAGSIRKFDKHMIFNTWISLVHYYIAHKDLFAPKESVIRLKKSLLINHFMKLMSN